MKITYSEVIHFTPLDIDRLVDIYVVRDIVSFWIGVLVVGLVILKVFKYI